MAGVEIVSEPDVVLENSMDYGLPDHLDEM
jgi:hypothetical protein